MYQINIPGHILCISADKATLELTIKNSTTTRGWSDSDLKILRKIPIYWFYDPPRVFVLCKNKNHNRIALGLVLSGGHLIQQNIRYNGGPANGTLLHITHICVVLHCTLFLRI